MHRFTLKRYGWIAVAAGMVALGGAALALGGSSSEPDATTDTPGRAAAAATTGSTIVPTAAPTIRALATAAATAGATAAATDTATAAAAEAPTSFESVAELMDTLADDDPYLGPDDAPVVIVEFSDYACPYCGKFYLETLPLILEAYPDEVKYVHRDYPIFGDVSFTLAESVDCALEQGKFWEMHGIYLELLEDADTDHEHRQPSQPGERDDRFDFYSDEKILELAGNAGLDLSVFAACMNEKRYFEEVYADYEIGAMIGIESVPFFIVNGQGIIGAQPFELFQQAIDESLAAEG